MYRDLTKGNLSKTLLLFALPMIAGNLLQQFYNIADTLIVGQFLGRDALAAVGSSYTLMTFLTSILLGPVSYTHLRIWGLRSNAPARRCHRHGPYRRFSFPL